MRLLLALSLALPLSLTAQSRASSPTQSARAFLGALALQGSAVSSPRVGSTPPPGASWLEAELQQGPGAVSPTTDDYLLGIAGAVGGGVLLGGGLGLLGSQLGNRDAQENVEGTVGAIVLGGLGYSVGSVLGAYGVGSRRHPGDSRRSTWVGGLIGMLAGTAIGFAQPGDNLTGLWLSAALLGPPVGAVVGFYN